jgi:hypothetical protein
MQLIFQGRDSLGAKSTISSDGEVYIVNFYSVAGIQHPSICRTLNLELALELAGHWDPQEIVLN